MLQTRHSHYVNSQSKLKFLPSPCFVNRAAPISISLAFGPHSCAITVNVTVGGWPSGSTVRFTPMLFPEMMNTKQGNSMYHFSSLWYDSTGYPTLINRVQSEHSNTGPRTHYRILLCIGDKSRVSKDNFFDFMIDTKTERRVPFSRYCCIVRFGHL